MSQLSKPLYSLTVAEYIEVNQKIVKQQLLELLSNNSESLQPKSDQDIIFIDEACELTGYSKPTLYSKISKYEIPVLSRGKPLTFSKKELIQWIHEGKPKTVDVEVSEYLSKKRTLWNEPCQFVVIQRNNYWRIPPACRQRQVWQLKKK